MNAENEVAGNLLALQRAVFPSQEGQVDREKMQRRIDRCRSNLSAQDLRRFDLRKGHFGNSSVVKLEDGVCKGCQIVPGQIVIRKAKEGQTPSCPHCNRILYTLE